MSPVPDILYLAHRVPYPPDKGDRIRTWNMIRFLTRRARVHLACLADEPVPAEALVQLRGACAQVAVVSLGWSRWWRALGTWFGGRTVTEGAFQSPNMVRLLTSWCGVTRFQAAVASASSLVPYLRLPALRSVPAIVDSVDVDSQKWLDYAAVARGPRAWFYRLEGSRLRCLEADLPAEFAAVLLVSPAEAAIYRSFCRPGRVEAVTNGVDLDYFQPCGVGSEDSSIVPCTAPRWECVFVGALDYYPNVDGLLWFCREVWPAIRRAQPAARFSVVGRRPVAAVQQLAIVPGVELVGQVPDVRPFVRQAAVVVAPLRLARGLQNKVLEALALGKAVVASPPALAALTVKPDVHLLAADTPAEWVDAVLTLWQDAALRQRLGRAGRRYVEDYHRWEHCLQPLAELLKLPP